MSWYESIRTLLAPKFEFYALHDIEIAKLDDLLNLHFENWLQAHNLDISFVTRYDSNPSQSCGHVFERGDVIYRCKDCTHDETCVLCSSCFQEKDHFNHQVSFSISKGSGGSCDCGEDESWRNPLSCPAHYLSHTNTAFDQDYKNMQEVCYQFFASFLLQIVPYFSLDPVSKKLSLESDAVEAALVLFNDENHSYDDVITALNVGKVSSAEYYAKAIDTHVTNILLTFTKDVLGICHPANR